MRRFPAAGLGLVLLLGVATTFWGDASAAPAPASGPLPVTPATQPAATRPARTAVALTPRPIWTGHEDVPARKDDDATWKDFRQAMLDFQGGSLSRDKFLSTCKELLAAHPGSRYEPQWEDLIAALEREAAAGEPAFVKKPPDQRTRQEEIAYRVYQLRGLEGHQFSDPGSPMLFAFGNTEPTPADRLVAIGPVAIPQLIEALSDNTPTRTIAWQRSFYSVYFVLRRQDIALKCLERIAGCQFYDEGATWMHFHVDTPQRQASVLENIRAWWKQSEGRGQAQMIRSQLALRGQNLTLRNYDEIAALETLAMLEGQRAVIDRARQLLADDHYGLNSPIVELMEKIDRPSVVRGVMERFWAEQSKAGDYTTLLKYGDRKVYQEMARRLEQTGKLDPGPWNMGDQAYSAARCGQNWAIPLVARMLQETKMTGSRMTLDGKGSVSFSTADSAMESFVKLTGQAFGYQRDASVEARLAAIGQARQWWEKTGREELKDTIAADHPPVAEVGDLLVSEAQIDQRVKAIEGSDRAARGKVLGELGTVYSWRVQAALLAALAKSDDTPERLAILRVLRHRPSLWMLPTLAGVFQDAKAEVDVRLLAGQILRAVVADKSTSIWWRRLETRDTALAAARQVLLTRAAPHQAELQAPAAAILQAWGWWDDLRWMESLKITPATAPAPRAGD